MTRLSETEFARIADGIWDDRESIVKNNPLGGQEEVLLWMLLSCLISYLNLSDLETPCFTGKPDAGVYREAITFVLRDRMSPPFDPQPYLERLREKSEVRVEK